MKRILVVLACLSACNLANKEQKIKSGMQKTAQLYVGDKLGNTEKKEIVDSLKWIIYSLNYDHLARHYIRETTAITPVKCDIILWEIVRKRDTSTYYFSAFYKDSSERYWMAPDDYIGVATVGGRPRYTVGGHATYVKPKTVKDADEFFLHHDSLFIHYITHYNGEINEWLKAEVARRGIKADKK